MLSSQWLTLNPNWHYLFNRPPDSIAPMRSLLLLTVVGSLTFPILATAQSRTAIAVAGGASVPIGSLRDTQISGTDFIVGLIRGSDDIPVGLRLDADYGRLRGKSVGGTTQPTRRTVSGTANIVVSFSGYAVKPYVLAGVGGFKMKSTPPATDSKLRFGFDFGLGITVPVAGKAAFVETRVNSISQPNAKPLRYVPIVLGFLF
jgi:opacity protein-like surface antigen